MMHSMLSNMTLGILILLLLILIFVVYYVWNDSKKNRNQIMILESDVASLRDTVGDLHKKLDDVMGHGVEVPRKQGGGGANRMNETSEILQSFMNQLNFGDLMNQGYFEDEGESGEEDSSEEEESGSGEEESYEEESGEEESGSGEEESGEEESGEEESGEEESGEEESGEETESVEEERVEEEEHASWEPEPVVEEEPSPEEPKVEELIPDLSHLEINFTGKKPSADPTSLDEGYIQAGGDGKQYVVALNKRGAKYWKVYKA
jgi:hypothetical protein